MIERRSILRLMGTAVVMSIVAIAPSARSQVGLERKIVLHQDLAIPGYEVIVADVTLAVGGREGRHRHAGTLIGRVLEGELTLEVEGQPTRIVKAGESLLVEPGVVHEGINKGTVPIRALATFIVEKGKPLTTPAK
jgi:quercetin dioxygenase-like cupin family protein